MRRGRPTNFLDLFIILTLVLGVLGVRAVRAGELGSVQGQVLQRGTAVALQASVSIRCGSTQRTATADGSGAFSFTGLPLGSCTVTASLAGFSTASQKVKVTAAGVAVKLALAISAKDEDAKKQPEAKPVAGRAVEKEMPSPSVAPPSPMKVKRSIGIGSTASAGAIGRKGGMNMPGPAGGPMVQQEQDPNFNTEGYSRIDDNPFRYTETDPLSTFSSDVDTASYSNLRRFLGQGSLPPKDSVRIEEMINYFHYDYPAPKGSDPFSITTEVSPSPWSPKHQLVRIGLKAPAIDDRQVPARNLVFLLDVSGSMSDPNKLPLLKQAMNLLVDTLRPEDKVSIAVYAGSEGMALAPTSGNQKDKIRQAIFALESGGSTNGAAGIQLAYNMAEANKIKNGINRVILCTDGDFNVGTTSEGDLTRLIEKERERGIFLTVLGFGMGNLKDSTMEKLADRGNGNYGYIDSLFEARKILVKEAGATLVTVAKDVKLQVEFNPALVAGYRLIGYENRLLRNEDFNDDKKDAGDIGAGHSVTALYEIVPVGVAVPAGKVDELKYQKKAAPAAGANGGELLTVKVRYKEPNGSTSKLLSQPVRASESKVASSDFQWAVAMAGFGMLLRESPHRGTLTWNQVAAIAASSIGKDPEGYRKQAIEMINAASKMKRAAGN
jgi:Ca-activated chloride channel homolog